MISLPRNIHIFCLLIVTIISQLLYIDIVYSKAVTKEKHLHEWYNHYYLHKDNAQVIAAMNYYFASDFPSSAVKKYSLQGFFATLFRQHPRQAVKWIKNSHLNKKERKPLIFALAQASLLKEAISLSRTDGWSKSEVKSLHQIKIPPMHPPHSVTHLEIGWLWGAYKSSGQAKYLATIIDSLLLTITSPDSHTNESFQETIIQTLQYHRSRDRLVEEFFQARYKIVKPAIQEELELLFAAHEEDDTVHDCD